MLPGDKPEPGREIARPAELAQVGREGCDRHRANRSNPRHRLKLARDIAFLRRSRNAGVQSVDFGAWSGDPVEVESPHVPDEAWKAIIFFDTHGEVMDIADTFSQNDTMFGKVPSECVHQLGALSDKQIAGAKEHCLRLLFGGLHRHTAPSRRSCAARGRSESNCPCAASGCSGRWSPSGCPTGAAGSRSAGSHGPGCAHHARPRRQQPLRCPSAAVQHPGSARAENRHHRSWRSRPEGRSWSPSSCSPSLSSVFEQPQTTKKRGGRPSGRAQRYAKGFACSLLHHSVGHYRRPSGSARSCAVTGRWKTASTGSLT